MLCVVLCIFSLSEDKMNNLVKSAAIWASIAFMPINADANKFDIDYKNMKDGTSTELFVNLKGKSDNMILEWVGENLDWEPVNPALVVNAVLNYFEEEVKSFDLSSEAKLEIVGILSPYLRVHPILKISDTWEVIFVIDDKKEFTQMVKKLVKVVIDDMPFLLRKVAIPIFFGGAGSIQRSLDNLDVTVMNMKEKQYKDVVFDYLWGIIKRVLKSANKEMKIWDYYDDIRRYYLNRNSAKIMSELEGLWLKNQDMKNLKYPFKK